MQQGRRVKGPGVPHGANRGPRVGCGVVYLAEGRDPEFVGTAGYQQPPVAEGHRGMAPGGPTSCAARTSPARRWGRGVDLDATTPGVPPASGVSPDSQPQRAAAINNRTGNAALTNH